MNRGIENKLLEDSTLEEFLNDVTDEEIESIILTDEELNDIDIAYHRGELYD